MLRGSPRRSGERNRVTSTEDDRTMKIHMAPHGPQVMTLPQGAVSSSMVGSGLYETRTPLRK